MNGHSGNDSWILAVLGAGLLLGFLAQVVGRRAHVPRVTMLLLIGIVAGPSVLDLVPAEFEELFPIAAQVALSMIGFLLGQHFHLKELRSTGKVVVALAVAGAVVPALTVVGGLLAFGVAPVFAILLASVAAATDPAATVDVIREVGAKGLLSDTVEGVVAVDDAVAVLIFSILVVAAELAAGHAFSGELLWRAVYEVGGALVLGVALGLPMAAVTSRVRRRQPTLIEALGFVLLAGGVSGAIGVSYLLTCMTMGTVVANLTRHHTRAFLGIQGAMDPFLVIFFLMAGLEFRVGQLMELGAVGVVYLVMRSFGKVAGAWLGAAASRAEPKVSRYAGWCLLPQAGVALGMGLVAAERFPSVGPQLLTLLIGTTVLFELFGPIATRVALFRSGESGALP